MRMLLLACMVLTAALPGQEKRQIVKVTPGYATVITCPVAPDLVTVGNPDDFAVQKAGNHVLVKPLITSGTTNMFIKAGVESYTLLLQVAEVPDLEVPLASMHSPLSRNYLNGSEDDSSGNGYGNSKRRPISELSPEVVGMLNSRFKLDNRYTYSVNNSKIVFAIDHMKQIKDRLYIIGTIINGSNIPYDIGYVRFKLVDYARNYVFWKKKVKETEIEPLNVFYNNTVRPHTTGRLLFVFDKHGFSEHSYINIKCNEESGRRDLVLEVPGSMVE